MADKRDYYEVLGVDKKADEAKIKNAYRKLAKKYHPDSNPGDADAEAKFKEASEAYAVLSDPEKRKQYDRFGHSAFDGSGGGGGGFDFSNMGDIFSEFFGGFAGGGSGNSWFDDLFGGRASRSRGPEPSRGADVRVSTRITMHEAFTGAIKKINVKGLEFIHDKSEGAYMYLDRVNISTNKDPEAIMELDYKTSTGTSRKLFKVKQGDNLKDLSGGLTQYEGYVVSEVDGRLDDYDNVKFINGTEIRTGEIIGNVDENQFVRMQIRETIISHFEKEKSLFKKGIKVLSLFFIDEVKKYRDYEEEDTKGTYAHVFEEEYQNIANEYRDLHDPDYTRYLDSFNK